MTQEETVKILRNRPEWLVTKIANRLRNTSAPYDFAIEVIDDAARYVLIRANRLGLESKKQVINYLEKTAVNKAEDLKKLSRIKYTDRLDDLDQRKWGCSFDGRTVCNPRRYWEVEEALIRKLDVRRALSRLDKAERDIAWMKLVFGMNLREMETELRARGGKVSRSGLGRQLNEKISPTLRGFLAGYGADIVEESVRRGDW